MKLGTGYPKGPLEWANQIGEKEVKMMLAAMSESVSDDRYLTPS